MAILTAAAASLLDAAKSGDERAFEILLRPMTVWLDDQGLVAHAAIPKPIP